MDLSSGPIFTLKPAARTVLFLGYFVHIVRSERDGIIAKDLR